MLQPLVHEPSRPCSSRRWVSLVTCLGVKRSLPYSRAVPLTAAALASSSSLMCSGQAAAGEWQGEGSNEAAFAAGAAQSPGRPPAIQLFHT